MKLLLLTALCALALAEIPSSTWESRHFPQLNIQENVFRSGKQYQFVYNGQLATGIPQSSKQHAFTRIQALVSLYFKGDKTCVLEIERCRMGKMNRRIPNPRYMVPFQAFDQVKIESDLLAKLKAPVKFTYDKGMISEVVFDGREEPWSANIKRGILNMLQVNLHKHGQTDQSEEATLTNQVQQTETPELDFFSVMENTLEGQCETLYTVTSQPSPYTSEPCLNVTKSINFEKCQKRPEIKYNWRFEDPCPTCEPKYAEDEKFLKASTVGKYKISGTPNQFLIESCIMESQYNVVPFNRRGNMISTYVNQTLVLVTSGPCPSRIPQPRSPQQSDSDMIYSPDWDIAKEKMFMNSEEEFLRETPYSELKNKVQFVTEILRQLVSEVQETVKEQAPRQYVRLVKVFRMLTRSEIEQCHESLYVKSGKFTPEQHKKVKEFIVDALADAGTKNTISHMIQKIKSRDISPLRAAITIKSLINCRVVSKEMIEEMMQLAESPVCQRNWFLKQSVLLTMGSMTNALCQYNEDKLASEFKHRPERFCPMSFKEQLVQKMFEKFRSAQNFQDKVLCLKTIGNMGIELSIFELEKIIKNVEYSEKPEMRVQAVLAMRQIRHTMPRKVQKVCMPIFMSRYQPTQLRIACAYEILQCLPERPVLDQMSRKLFSERNPQVASFLYSYMITLANSTNPCLKKFSRDLQLSLRHGKQIGYCWLPSYSKYIHTGFHSQKYRLGLNAEFGYVMSKRSLLPRTIAMNLHGNFLGLWSKNFLTLGVTTQDMDSLLQKYVGPKGYWNEMNLEDILVREPRSAKTSSPKMELKNLWKKLKTVQRSLPTNPKGFFFMKYKDQDFGMLPFNMETMTETFGEFISEGRINLREIERFLESGYNFHIYKAAMMYEMSYKIPTTMGMPLVFSLKVPTVMQLTGQIRAEISQRWQKVKVELKNTKPSFVSSMVADVQCWSPIVNSGLKVVGMARVNTPIHGKMEMDLTSSPYQLVTKITPPQESTKWIHVETRPITYTRVWPKYLKNWVEPQERTILGEEWTRMYNLRQDFPIVKTWEEFCEKALGMQLRIRGLWHHTPSMKLATTPFCPLSGPNSLSIWTSPVSDSPKEYIIKLSSQIFNQRSSPLRWSSSQMSEFLQPESSSEEQIESEWNSYKSSQHHESWFKVEMKTKGSSKSCQCEWETKVKCDPELRLCKLESVFERSRIPEWDSKPFKMCLESEVLYPSTPYSLTELSGKKIVSSLKTTWGRSCSQNNYVSLKVQAQRSRQQMEMMQSEPEYSYYSSERCQNDREQCSPVSMYQRLLKAAQLCSYELECDWQNVHPYVKQAVSKCYRALKTYFYWNAQVDNVQVQHQSNQIKARFTLDPRSQQYLNVTIKTPYEKTILRDLPLPVPVRPVSMMRSSQPISSFSDMYTSVSQMGNPVCHVSSNRISTFDEVEYQVPITTCWSVLAKDCQSENFAVLMKKKCSDCSQKKVKILLRSHKIVLVPRSQEYESVQVMINGEQTSIEEPQVISRHGHQIVRIEKTGSYVKVSLPESGVRVYFDGYACNIKMTPMLRNIQCGLCGHYDSDPEDEFRTPEYELESDVRSFYQKYTLKEQGCEYPSQMSQICSEPECRYYTPYQSYESSWESQESSQEGSQEQSSEEVLSQSRQTYEPVERTKVIEQSYKICFSKVPVPYCPHHTYPSKHNTQKRKVSYCCLPRDDPEAQSLIRQVKIQKITPQRISSLPESFTQTESQPISCSRL